jgi:hypothetical protein
VLGAVCVFVVLAWLEIAKVAGHDRKIIRLVIVHTNETHFGKRKSLSQLCCALYVGEERDGIPSLLGRHRCNISLYEFLYKKGRHTPSEITEKKRKEKEKKKKGIDDGDWQVCVWQRQGNNEPHTGTSSRILTNNQRLFSSLAFL